MHLPVGGASAQRGREYFHMGYTSRERMRKPCENLFKKLSLVEAAITYMPLQSEPNPETCIFTTTPPIGFTIPAERSVDPVETARQVTAFFENTRVCVYIPGTAFDARGVRHGRGGGWYDRFLSHVPLHWIRIGFCFEHQFSQTSLSREVWDEAVDWVCVKTATIVECHETQARTEQ